MKKVWMVMVFFLLFIGRVEANQGEIGTGNKFLEFCGNTKVLSTETAYCIGVIRGIMAGRMEGALDVLEYLVKDPEITKKFRNLKPLVSVVNPYCGPEQKIPGGQVFLILLKYLRENPQILHDRIAKLLTQSLIEAFPCPRK